MPEENVDNGEPKVFLTYTCAGLAVLVGVLAMLKLIDKPDAMLYIGTLIPLAIAALRRGQRNDAKAVKKALGKQEEVVKTALVQAEVVESQGKKC